MSQTITTRPLTPPPSPAPERGRRRPDWRRVGPMLAAMALAAVLNTWALGQNGYANIFYSAGVKSMLQSWHNFFFVSADPGGLVSIDKPPLGLWVQAASAKMLRVRAAEPAPARGAHGRGGRGGHIRDRPQALRRARCDGQPR